ncbi:hypothetical protein HU200_029714 [Digitaria exilis]|uniref:Probable glutathione S-transferase GSTU1 n=1 Tax=Digitaria exilis TaxID=1010633 RepID=A0A835BTY7_9POAL|nr:hypothetical protein HU200_029714 [Digitaria exilis]
MKLPHEPAVRPTRNSEPNREPRANRSDRNGARTRTIPHPLPISADQPTGNQKRTMKERERRSSGRTSVETREPSANLLPWLLFRSVQAGTPPFSSQCNSSLWPGRRAAGPGEALSVVRAASFSHTPPRVRARRIARARTMRCCLSPSSIAQPEVSSQAQQLSSRSTLSTWCDTRRTPDGIPAVERQASLDPANVHYLERIGGPRSPTGSTAGLLHSPGPHGDTATGEAVTHAVIPYDMDLDLLWPPATCRRHHIHRVSVLADPVTQAVTPSDRTTNPRVRSFVLGAFPRQPIISSSLSSPISVSVSYKAEDASLHTRHPIRHCEKKPQGLQLLDFWVSPFGQRCRIALAEKNLPYEYLEQDLRNKSELLLKSNPIHKKIPVLLHDGRPICESLIILQYIDEAFPSGTRLLPAGDPYARAQARFWADYIDKKVYECGTRLWKLKGEPQQQARAEMVEILRTLEGALGDGKFFGGEAFGFVDVALVPFTAWFLTYERYGEFSVEKECPKLAAWAKRCGERESVAKNLSPPEKVYGFVGDLKKRLGIEGSAVLPSCVPTWGADDRMTHDTRQSSLALSVLLLLRLPTDPHQKRARPWFIDLAFQQTHHHEPEPPTTTHGRRHNRRRRSRASGRRVRIALAEKGLAYERDEQDLAAKSDLLRSSNPVHGKVPVLFHMDRPICESLVILQYLDEAFPETPPLLPPATDPYARARARFWAEYSERLHLVGKRLWLRRREHAGNGDGDDDAELEAAREEMAAVMRAMEGELGGREFFGGEAFGYVDAAAAPFAAWFLTYERHGGPSVAGEFPGMAAWAAQCLRRESVAANVYSPEKVCELVQEYRQWLLTRK